MKARVSPVVRDALVGGLTFYQRYISPQLGARCRFEPTCSAYGREALSRYGAWRGLWLTALRLVRCQPYCKGGIDPVP